MSCALSGAQLCHEGPSEVSPGCDAVGAFIDAVNDGVEVMPTHFAGSLDEWMSV